MKDFKYEKHRKYRNYFGIKNYSMEKTEVYNKK